MACGAVVKCVRKVEDCSRARHFTSSGLRSVLQKGAHAVHDRSGQLRRVSADRRTSLDLCYGSPLRSHLPSLRVRRATRHADGRLPVLSRVQRVQGASAAAPRALLRILFFWLGSLSAGAGGKFRLLRAFTTGSRQPSRGRDVKATAPALFRYAEGLPHASFAPLNAPYGPWPSSPCASPSGVSPVGTSPRTPASARRGGSAALQRHQAGVSRTTWHDRRQRPHGQLRVCAGSDPARLYQHMYLAVLATRLKDRRAGHEARGRARRPVHGHRTWCRCHQYAAG